MKGRFIFSIKSLLVYVALGISPLAYAQEDFPDWKDIRRPECFIHFGTPAYTPGGPRYIGSQATAPMKAQGSPHVPVILVQFADTKFITPSSDASEINTHYTAFFNGDAQGNPIDGNSHSVKGYFAEQSDNIFQPHFTVIGPVTLDNNTAYYGANNASNTSKDLKITEFYSQAIQKAQEVGFSTWNDFDNNADGVVDMVFFLYAGLGENNSKVTTDIWPKESTARITVGGITFAGYGCVAERLVAGRENGVITSTRPDGIGTFCHEMSHAIGLPDFYDTKSNPDGDAMDILSLMDYGAYINNNKNPCGYTAYERDFMGWRPLETLTEPCLLTLEPISRGGKGYKIVNPENANEYYTLENRQAFGADAVLARRSHGLQILHVDYQATRWNANTVNRVQDHQCMTFIPANNNYNTVGRPGTTQEAWIAAMQGWLWPGDQLNYNLTDETTPAATVFTARQFMGQPIRNIMEHSDGTVSLCFRTNGQLSAPTISPVDTEEDFAVFFVENATKYELEVYEGDVLLKQFSGPSIAFMLSDLPQERNLRLRARALADSPEDYLTSPWSDWFELNTTGINAQRIKDDPTIIYNLHGERVLPHALTKGIYIRKGKKIII